MPRLRCSVRNCSRNKEDYCTLNYIEVEGNGATNSKATNCANFDSTQFAASNEAHDVQQNVDISCNAAGCIHNRDRICGAKDIRIGGASTASCIEDTECGSFWCI